MPLQRRVPKFGFKSFNRIECKPVNLDSLQELGQKLDTDTLTLEILVENGLVSKKDVVKVLGRGELTSKLSVSAHYFSASAAESIEKAGGTANKI